MTAPAHWFVSVGELSGDVLAADLVHQIKIQHPSIQFSGIIGPAMAKEGVSPIGRMDELNVMGTIEVIKKLAAIKILKNRILEFIDRHHIRVAILVDFAGFHIKLAEELKMRGIRVIQYVAPKLWAWGEKRITKLRMNVDLLLATFPFEQTFFQERGVNCHYVGCPIAERTADIHVSKEELGFAKDQVLIALLPGSRGQEVRRLLGPMLAIAEEVKRHLPSAQFIIPIASSLQDSASQEWFASFGKKHVHFAQRNSLEVMSAADVALVASGTATLECALVMTPLVVIYSMNPLTYCLAKKYVKVAWASLVNILRAKSVVREFLQDFEYKDVAEELLTLVNSSPKKGAMLQEFASLRQDLSLPTRPNALDHINQLLNLN